MSTRATMASTTSTGTVTTMPMALWTITSMAAIMGIPAIVVLSTVVQDQIEAAVQAALAKVLALTTLSSLAVSGLFLLALVVPVIQYADTMYLSLWTSHFRQRSPGHRPSVVGILISHFHGHQGRAQGDEKLMVWDELTSKHQVALVRSPVPATWGRWSMPLVGGSKCILDGGYGSRGQLRWTQKTMLTVLECWPL